MTQDLDVSTAPSLQDEAEAQFDRRLIKAMEGPKTPAAEKDINLRVANAGAAGNLREPVREAFRAWRKRPVVAAPVHVKKKHHGRHHRKPEHAAEPVAASAAVAQESMEPGAAASAPMPAEVPAEPEGSVEVAPVPGVELEAKGNKRPAKKYKVRPKGVAALKQGSQGRGRGFVNLAALQEAHQHTSP